MRKLTGLLLAALAVAGAANAATRAHIPVSVDPTIVRVFTTSAGTHYFNGSQLVTCTPTGACGVQDITAKDIVPYLTPSSGRLLVLTNSLPPQACTLSLENCVTVDWTTFPGARRLTLDGQVKLQGGKGVPICGYTPTAGYNCGGFKSMPTGPMVDRAMAVVGQQGATMQQVYERRTTGESLTYKCSPGMQGCSVAFIAFRPDNVTSTVSSASDGGSGTFSTYTGTGDYIDPSAGPAIVEDDSAAYGQYDVVLASNATEVDAYNAQVLDRCKKTMCDANFAVENNFCSRIFNEVGAIGSGLSLGTGAVFALATDGLAGWGAYKAGMYLTAGSAGTWAYGCGTVITNKQRNCWDWCDANFGPGGWYIGP